MRISRVAQNEPHTGVARFLPGDFRSLRHVVSDPIENADTPRTEAFGRVLALSSPRSSSGWGSKHYKGKPSARQFCPSCAG